MCCDDAILPHAPGEVHGPFLLLRRFSILFSSFRAADHAASTEVLLSYEFMPAWDDHGVRHNNHFLRYCSWCFEGVAPTRRNHTYRTQRPASDPWSLRSVRALLQEVDQLLSVLAATKGGEKGRDERSELRAFLCDPRCRRGGSRVGWRVGLGGGALGGAGFQAGQQGGRSGRAGVLGVGGC